MIVCTETVFTLHTTHTSYQLAVAPNGMVLHTYYGTRLPEDVPSLADARMPHSDPGCWPDLLPQELSGCGTADNRTPAVIPEYADGTEAAAFVFDHAVVTPGKPQLPGLPMFRTGEGVETLSVFLKDAGGLVVELRYSVYEAEDLITRTAVYTNAGTQPLTLHKAASLSVDFAPDALELITLNGTWAAERTPERAALRCGIQSIGSMRGIPGHAHNPAVALCHADTTETTGDAWGFAFVYSGNYLIEAERCDAGERLVMGIHPYHFHWTLAPGESFTAPEAAMVYSDKGLGEMSRRFHNAIRTRLLPPRWQDMAAPRPVLINSWEACYFDFDEKKLLALAQASKKADIDLFVLDDGWFKGRNDPSSSLGDWAADTRKLPQGLPGLCKKINLLGLDMGLWVEPEAISPDSDLYRAHPDWAFGIPGREPLEIRQQHTLDFSRPEVVEGIWQQLDAVLQSCPLKYLKWDMNRSLAQVYSAALPAKRQGEVYHRYVLGVYELQRRLTEKYPHLLLENCAGGGARFDCGMLYYSPQIWCSDNSDAIDRLRIQYGTSFGYPVSAMGAHVSAVPNHQTGRITPLHTRGVVAMSGTFGYELDLLKLTEEEKDEVRSQIGEFRKYAPLIQNGRYYRLTDPFKSEVCAWEIVGNSQEEVLLNVVMEEIHGNMTVNYVQLRGLDESALYKEQTTGRIYSGAALMHGGMPLPAEFGEYRAYQYHFVRE